VCSALVEYSVQEDKCTGCGACLRACPAGAITGAKKQPHFITTAACIKCGSCIQKCKFDAILKA
jgi:NADH-quinone oxidoreductase subunit F